MEGDGELNHPLDRPTSKKLIRAVLQHGEVTHSKHAREEMAKDKITIVDVTNVLRGGWCNDGECENGGWRYQVRTNSMCVVVEFLSEHEVFVVTAWREKR